MVTAYRTMRGSGRDAAELVEVPRHPQDPDCSPFAELMAEALRAFATDVEYATAMAARASVVLVRRQVWQARTDVRQAEAAAVARCRAAGSFTCDADTLVCGIGSCRWATPELATVVVMTTAEGRTAGRPRRRPQLTSSGEPATTCAELAVRPLLDLQTAWRRRHHTTPGG